MTTGARQLVLQDPAVLMDDGDRSVLGLVRGLQHAFTFTLAGGGGTVNRYLSISPWLMNPDNGKRTTVGRSAQ